MSKEKYQEALDELYDDAINGEPLYVKQKHIKAITEYRDELQELVDIYPEYLELKAKATPIKLKEEEIGNIIHLHCPNCKRVVTHETEGGRRYITKHNYCHKCGQALDWEND